MLAKFLPFGTFATRSLLVCGVALLVAAPAFADSPPASIPSAGDESARLSFAEFAKTWIARMQNAEQDHRAAPTVRAGATSTAIEYRGVGDDYQVELRPTGHPSSPFIGILRYTERVYSCRDASSSNCSVASSSPVTEIFRYKGGRWVY